MEFNTGGTADSSNSGAMTGGTMASSMYKNGGGLKPIPKGNKGLPKLPKSVRNKMGYMAQGGGVGKNKKPKYKIGQLVYSYQNKDTKYPINYIKDADDLGIIRYRISLPDGNSNWINEEGIYTNSISGEKMAKGGKMEWGGTAESSETGEFIGGENASSMYGRGGHVSKGEMVWKKISSSEKMNFLNQNFTPEITPRSQEILVGKAWNFLPKNVKIKFEAKYANVENYGEGGGTGVSSETGTPIGGENQSSMFENGGSISSFEYTIGGL